MRWLCVILCVCLVLPPRLVFGACVTSDEVLHNLIPNKLHSLNPESLKGQLKIDIQKEKDEVVISLNGQTWILKISELIQFYQDLKQQQTSRLPEVWLGKELGHPLLRAEYDYWVSKLFLQLELSARPNRVSRIWYMLSHREFFHSWMSMIVLPLVTWMLGQSIHFNYLDHWNKFEKTFLYVNSVSRTVGNAIRLDEVHYQDPKRTRFQLFWLVIFISLSSQMVGTGITALYGSPVYPRLDRALVVALAVILYDIPISKLVHRFQFSNGLLPAANDIKAADIRRSQIVAEYVIQTFLRVSGTFVLQGMIHVSNGVYDSLLPLLQSML